MISKQNLGQALEWIQRKTLRITIKFVSAVSNDIGPLLYRHRFFSAIKAASDSVAVVVDGHYVNLLSTPIVDLIGEFSGTPMMHNPPKQEGNWVEKKHMLCGRD